jgi:hypothetical protein
MSGVWKRSLDDELMPPRHTSTLPIFPGGKWTNTNLILEVIAEIAGISIDKSSVSPIELGHLRNSVDAVGYLACETIGTSGVLARRRSLLPWIRVVRDRVVPLTGEESSVAGDLIQSSRRRIEGPTQSYQREETGEMSFGLRIGHRIDAVPS